MYAVVRLNTFDERELAAAGDRLAEFDRIHSAQPGYEGSLTVDLGSGRRLVVNLWRSAEEGRAALEVLIPHVDRLLGPLMSAPSQLVGAGPVLASDLTRA